MSPRFLEHNARSSASNVGASSAAAPATHIAIFQSLLANSKRRAEGPSKLRKVVSSPVKSRWPEWIKPSTCTEPISLYNYPPGDGRLSIRAIIKGQTKNPITLSDLKAFLGGVGGSGDERRRDIAALDFLLVLEMYKSAFFNLAPAERAPRPSTVMEHFSLLQFGAPQTVEDPLMSGPPVPPKDEPPASPMVFDLRHSRHRLTLPPPVAARFKRVRESPFLASSIFYHNREERPRYSPVHSPSVSTPTSSPVPSNLLDPALQPFRSELQVIIDNHLSGTTSRLLTTIVPPNVIMDALSETELTTHPETLEPLANLLIQYLDEKVLPEFLDQAVVNLSTTTKIGRVIIAWLCWSLVITLTALSMAFPHGFPRAARLIIIPFVIIGIGYMLGSQKGVCFVLAWRGVRELKWYEVPVADPEKGMSVASIAQQPASRPLSMRSFVDERLIGPGTFRSPLSSVHTLNSDHSSFRMTDAGARSSVSTTIDPNPLDKEKGCFSCDSKSGKQSINTSLTSMQQKWVTRKGWRWQTVLGRMTGTAVYTVPVEDQTVRERQTRIAVKVAAWLAFGSIAVMALVVSLPPVGPRSQSHLAGS
ncbi:hypothetical protein FRB94_006739 [Tulasnella sp. JGI-2019a]|nr:hypothetical protein FRB93_002063 [Tulasnella sp. JGI-2019a]KAG8998648.1 hypothetical protein FRB94_006739 [Tulasnella sp. JGI-2019a]KAG9023302.1 hypothetical protein FRB95_013273 [Tulasnella sp. JGI-2019a]